MQLALGSILREANARELPCGVFGSFGWSGEAVDEMEAKLKDGGYGFAFKPIKVKFKPTATVRGWCNRCRSVMQDLEAGWGWTVFHVDQLGSVKPWGLTHLTSDMLSASVTLDTHAFQR